jgi:hypothetical protein
MLQRSSDSVREVAFAFARHMPAPRDILAPFQSPRCRRGGIGGGRAVVFVLI